MILTVTMNPSVDISYPLTHFQLDDVNRVTKTFKTAGGKGLNVTRVLHLLGKPVIATGVVGGYLGESIKNKLTESGIKHQFYTIQEETRNSIAILHDDGQQTEILESGPSVTGKEEEGFLEHYQNLVREVRTVTISGSLAKGLSVDLYTTLIAIARQNNCAVLLDTSGEALKHAVQSKEKPALIKPNETEISQLLGEKVEEVSTAELVKRLKKPLFDGIEWIVVSMGAKGAIAKHEGDFYKVHIPKINVVNPVGSGDATLAGFALAMDQHCSDEHLLKTGMTTGMLNAMEQQTGWISAEYFETYYDQVIVEAIF